MMESVLARQADAQLSHQLLSKGKNGLWQQTAFKNFGH
jgi:hypothetical protein